MVFPLGYNWKNQNHGITCTMIAILSDFQHSDYLGVMKGIIYSVNPDIAITDLYNGVCQYNIKEGAWILLNNYSFFPKNTIFLCIVDPSVGSGRNPVIIQSNKYLFVGPDNGLLYPAAQNDGIINIWKIKTLQNISKTFHGRDVFARTAAQIEAKIKPHELGIRQNKLVKLNFYLRGRTGEIVRIDNFGNIITNLSPLNKKSYTLVYKGVMQKIKHHRTYAEAKEKQLFLVTGSSKTLEISIKNSNAAHKFLVELNSKITIQ